MTMNNMIVTQNRQYYTIYTPMGTMVGQLYLGQDGNYLLDAKLLDAVTKAMARRLGIATR